MPIVKMDRMTLVGLAEDREAIIEALMRLGAIEIIPQTGAENPETTRTSPVDERIQQTQNALSRLERAMALARKIDPKKKPMFTLKRPIAADRFTGAASREQAILEQVSGLEHNQAMLDDLRTRQHRLVSANELLAPWIGLDLDLSNQGTEHVRFFLGSLDNPAQIDELNRIFQEEAPETMIEALDGGDAGLPGSQRVIVATWEPRAPLVQNHLRRLSFNPLPLQGEAGTPRQIYEANHVALTEIRAQIENLSEDDHVLAAGLEDFETLYDNLTIRLDQLEEIARLAGTRNTFWLEGWLPSQLSDAVAKALGSNFTVAIESRPAEPGEEYPILLKNNRLVKPFEVVGEMFSPPSSQESDPSPWVAPFYFFFFGIMLSDVAYGLILTVICALLVYKVKVQGDFRRMSQMLLYCGISSMIWGALFGGFFGDMLTVVSGGRVSMPAIWFNPMDDPTGLMIWSIVFGVIHLFAGMFANALNLIRSGRWLDAVFDILPWYLIILGIGLMVAGPSLLPALGPAGQIMALVGVAIILLFGGRPAKNPITRLFKGLGALYNITSYLSDILSYTRILALVLATSVIAMVVNLMGFMIGPSIPGIIVFIIVAVAGHGLNLALSALSAYVHTSRLHYVEFFGKFYSGGGRMWKPLRQKTRFTEVSRSAPER